jgi:hypothetical protein
MKRSRVTVSVLVISAAMLNTNVAAAGRGWVIQPTPTPNGNAILIGVSCPSISECIAVGTTTTGQLAERWNGTKWAVLRTTGSQAPGAVSCPTTTDCTAVGSGSRGTMAERWKGTTWTVQPTPNPMGGHGTLYAVSCSSARACTAVGLYFTKSGGNAPIVERWNGEAWAIQPTPSAHGSSLSELLGVSCASASVCVAVGDYVNDSGIDLTLVERWNGATWVIQPTPNPSGTQIASLDAVSCSSATSCTAVGSYDTTPSVDLTLAEHWNGTSWVLQHTPNPSGGTFNMLRAVSCPSASACTAGGSFFNGSSSLTLAEGWIGGSWVIQPTSTTPVNAGFSGVSCPSTTMCTAVGSTFQGHDVSKTLAERD